MAIQYLSVSWKMYHSLAQKIAGDILSDSIQLDEIVAIARGGLSLGLILSDYLQIPIASITIQSYSDVKQQGALKITARLGQRIQGKHILLADDNAESGKTFQRSTTYLQTLKPASITTAVLFLKPQSQFIPNYIGMKTSCWTLLPHEVTEMVTTFTKRLKNEGKSENEIVTFLHTYGYTDKQIQFVRKYYPL